MPTLADSVGRTEQKLEYARLALGVHRDNASRHSGDAFERSQLEAFFFHFSGALDSFLHELNFHYELGLAIENVSRRTVREKVVSLHLACPPFDALQQQENDPNSYLALAKSMRNFIAHRGGLPMAHYFNGPTNLVHPTTRQEFNMDSNQLLTAWLYDLQALLQSQRTW